MKKILSSLFSLLLTFGLGAQVHQYVDVLNVSALNVGTNGWGVTNLSILVTNIGMVYNPTNTTYTNSSGSYVGTATTYLDDVGTTNSLTQATLFKDIPLWTDSQGRPITTLTWAESAAGLLTNHTWRSSQTLFIEYVNPRASNAPMGIVFRPIYDGVTPGTGTGEDWGVRIAGLETTKGTLVTNIPVHLWPGAKALRVVAVTNQYILAGPAAQTNSTFITKIRAAGFRP